MQGTIVISAHVGRALRRQRADLLATDVLWCTGDFRAGDRVHVAMRNVDGGQGVIATGIVHCTAAELRKAIDANDSGEPIVAITEQDMTLLWPSGS